VIQRLAAGANHFQLAPARRKKFARSLPRDSAPVRAAYLLEPYTGSATIFFGTIAVVVTIGACIPLLFGKETIGQLEMVTDVVPEPSKA